jgi:hypothetical protein
MVLVAIWNRIGHNSRVVHDSLNGLSQSGSTPSVSVCGPLLATALHTFPFFFFFPFPATVTLA